MGDGLRYTIALVWVPGTHNVSVVGSVSLWLCSELSAQEKDLPGGTCCLPYHRALGSLFSSENCVGVMSKSGCQLTVLYYKDMEVFEICAVFHGKSRGREEMNGEEERRINPQTRLSLNSVTSLGILVPPSEQYGPACCISSQELPLSISPEVRNAVE